jgi:hypothetical protein
LPTSHDVEDVNVLMTDVSRERHVPAGPPTRSELGSKAAEGAGIGGAIGGAVGAILAAFTSTAAIAIPGVGLIAAGPIAAGLAGAGAGGLAGTIVGALVGAGIPEERARLHDERLKRGRIALGARPRSQGAAMKFRREWKNHRGTRVHRSRG